MRIIAGDFTTVTVYTLNGYAMIGVPFGGSTPTNRDTVEAVELVDSRRQYNHAAGGVGMFAGAAFAGPVGAVVGGLLPNAFKDQQIEFVLRFKDGRVAHCVGKPSEYKAALKTLYKVAPVKPPKLTPEQRAERDRFKAERKRMHSEQKRLHAERAPERKRLRAEHKARSKEIAKADLSFSQRYQAFKDLDAEYRNKN